MPSSVVLRSVLVFAVLWSAACSKWPAEIETPQLRPTPREFEYRHDVALFRLTNGMKVAVDPDPNTNLVRVDVRYRVGTAEDPEGKTGLAHLVEHMTFETRPGPGAPTLGERLAAVSFAQNAFTTWGSTHYMSTALEDRLQHLLVLEAERMQLRCEQFEEDMLARERDIVVQEIHERSHPLTGTLQDILATAYGEDHPYARYVAGSASGIRGMTFADVCDFYEDYYAPDRAVLVVSGNVHPARVRSSVSRLFGPIERASIGDRPDVTPVRPTADASRHRADIEEPTALILFDRPPRGTREEVHRRVIELLMTARLFQAKGNVDFVTEIGAGKLGGSRAPASGFLISVEEEADLDRAVEMFFRERERMMQGITASRLASLTNMLRTQVVQRHETLGSRAMSIASYLQHGDDARLMVADLQYLTELPYATIEQGAKRAFLRSEAHVAHVIPAGDGAARVERPDFASLGEREYDIDTWKMPVDESEAVNPADLRAEPVGLRPRTVRLDNGLTLQMIPNLSHPLVDIRVTFPVGDLHDPDDRPGLAWFAATLLEKDLTRPFRTIDYYRIELIESWGGEPVATTSRHATTFRISGLSIYSDGLLWELYWLLTHGHYTDDSLERKRQEYRRRKANAEIDAYDVAVVLALRELFGDDHPYARSRSFASTAEATDTAALERFRREHYRADGATVIITGNFDAAELESRVRRLFGSWDGGEAAPPPPRTPAPRDRSAPAFIGVVDPDRLQPKITFNYAVAEGFRDRHAERLVMEEVLAQRVRGIRQELGASYGVHVDYHTGTGPGVITAAGDVAPDRAGEAFAAMREAIAPLRAGDIDPAEFVRARSRVLEERLASSIDSGGVASALAFTAVHGLPSDYMSQLPTAVAEVTIDDVRALREHFAERREVLVVLARSREAIEEIFGAAGIDGARIYREDSIDEPE